MKYLKISLMMMAMAIFAIPTMTAQTDPAPSMDKPSMERRAKLSPQERADMQTKKMAKHLDLSADQVAKINAINLEYANKAEAKKEERRARKKEREARIEAVLTADQKQKLLDRKTKSLKKRKDRKAKRKADARAKKALGEKSEE